MKAPLDLQSIRRRVAQRAGDLTGVSTAEIALELSPISCPTAGEDQTSWTLMFHGPSELVHAAVEQAIEEIKAEQRRLAARG